MQLTDLTPGTQQQQQHDRGDATGCPATTYKRSRASKALLTCVHGRGIATGSTLVHHMNWCHCSCNNQISTDW
jgi:hypothetical protein